MFESVKNNSEVINNQLVEQWKMNHNVFLYDLTNNI
jgi:hypothetical protein